MATNSQVNLQEGQLQDAIDYLMGSWQHGPTPPAAVRVDDPLDQVRYNLTALVTLLQMLMDRINPWFDGSASVSYVDTEIAVEATRASTVEAALDTRVTALEGA